MSWRRVVCFAQPSALAAVLVQSSGPASEISDRYAIFPGQYGLLGIFAVFIASFPVICFLAFTCKDKDLDWNCFAQSNKVETLRCNRQGRGRCDHADARRRIQARAENRAKMEVLKQSAKPTEPVKRKSSSWVFEHAFANKSTQSFFLHEIPGIVSWNSKENVAVSITSHTQSQANQWTSAVQSQGHAGYRRAIRS